MDNAEVFLSISLYFSGRMTLKAEQNFQQPAGHRRMYWQVEEMTTRRNHPCQLGKPVSQRDVLECPAGNDEVK